MFKSKLFVAVIYLFSLTLPTTLSAKSVDLLPVSKLKISIEFDDETLREYDARLKFLIDTAYTEYTALFNGPAKKLSGEPYDHLNVTVSRGFNFEADPETLELSISDKKLFGFYNWEMAVLHEVLHFWSGETFKYASGQEQWFNEGVSEYLTLRLSAKLGLIPKEQILQTFSKPISTYLSAKGVGELSLRKAGSTGELKRKHYFLVYHGGYVAGMVLDHQIRLKSNGTKSLNDLMRELYKSHSRSEPYSMESLVALIKQTTSQDYSQFFGDYIDGIKIIPVGAYFDIGWLGLSQDIGFKVTEPNQKVLLNMLNFE